METLHIVNASIFKICNRHFGHYYTEKNYKQIVILCVLQVRWTKHRNGDMDILASPGNFRLQIENIHMLTYMRIIAGLQFQPYDGV